MRASYIIEKTVNTGGMCKSRLKVKAFKDSQSMYTFLNKGDNGCHWKVSPKENLKSGTYVYAGQQWHNVKSVDPSALAHM